MNATKQHFELVARNIAAEVARNGAPTASKESTATWNALSHLARQFADDFGRTNERFDRSRFLKACGFPGLA